MAISINGSTNVITGVAVGGLPDGIVDADMLAVNAVTSGKLASGVGGKILQVSNTTLNTRDTLTMTNKYQNNDANIYYITGIDTTITTTQANSKILISGSISGEFSNREDFFGFTLSSTISGTTAPIEALRATTHSTLTNRPRYTFLPTIAYNATNNDSTPNTTQFSGYLYAPSQASGTAITIKVGVSCHTGSGEILYLNRCVNATTNDADFEHTISHMTLMEVAA